MPKFSICIPVYNQNVTTLLEELLEQRSSLTEEVEILVFEDGSVDWVKKHNFWLRNVKNLIYIDFKKNVGRSVIRNRLGQAASGQYLLFMDDDSLIPEKNFIRKYLNHLSENEVICGGRIYPEDSPGDEFTLHWAYGSHAESKSADERARQPHDAFHSNNFVVPRAVFMKIGFDESLRQYGHEDTMFGYSLRKNNIAVSHIDNVVLHSKLETNQEFLEKSQLALKNLYQLYLKQDGGFTDSVKILRTFDTLKKWKVTGLVAYAYRLTCNQLEQTLLYGQKPSLFIFNLYKLGYLANHSLRG